MNLIPKVIIGQCIDNLDIYLRYEIYKEECLDNCTVYLHYNTFPVLIMKKRVWDICAYYE